MYVFFLKKSLFGVALQGLPLTSQNNALSCAGAGEEGALNSRIVLGIWISHVESTHITFFWKGSPMIPMWKQLWEFSFGLIPGLLGESREADTDPNHPPSRWTVSESGKSLGHLSISLGMGYGALVICKVIRSTWFYWLNPMIPRNKYYSHFTKEETEAQKG